MSNREIYEVKVTRPKGVSVGDMQRYIKTAVAQWCKGGSPHDPVWNIGDAPVTVRRQTDGRCSSCKPKTCVSVEPIE